MKQARRDIPSGIPIGRKARLKMPLFGLVIDIKLTTTRGENMRCVYREKTYVCGDYKEVYIYPCFAESVKKGRRKPKAKPTPAAQKRVNRRAKENNLIRLLNANFTAKDIAFDLTYRKGEQPETDEQAKKDVQNFLRRLKRYRRAAGLPELKYIAVTERGSRGGRYHHHLVINGGVELSDLAAIWGKGYTKAAPLQFDETGLIAKGKYMTKQSLYFRSFNASKNLIHPQPTCRDGRLSRRKVQELFESGEDRAEAAKLYEGYRLAEAAEFYNDVNGGYYLELRLYKEQATFNGRKKRRKKPCKKTMSA